MLTKSKPLPLVVASNYQTKGRKGKQTKIRQVDKLKSERKVEVINESAFQSLKLPTKIGEFNDSTFQSVKQLKEEKKTLASFNRNGAPSRATKSSHRLWRWSFDCKESLNLG